MPDTYNPLTESIADELRAIVGSANVVFGDAEKLEPYSHDEVPDRRYAHMPEAIVRPDSAQQIAAIMQLANRCRVPVTPRGAGSGLSGGAVPLHGGIVLLTDRMNRIIEIDRENMMVVVEPGVVTSAINDAVMPLGLFYAGYPMSLETCFIGGNVAENAGGGKAVKYGVTARYVTGIEMVTPTGQIVTLGGKLIKDVTGYNMIGLMIGSEGTLGVFTKITLKLLPVPKASVDLLCLFPTAAAAIAAVPAIMTGSGIVPAAIEFMDQQSIRMACRYLNETLPYEDAGAMLLITLDGPDEQQVTRDYESIGKFCQAAGASEVFVADNATTSKRVWNVRKNIPEAYATISTHQANEDLVVPIASIPQLLEGMGRIAAAHGVHIPAYGHAGDGNLHTRIVKGADMPLDQWQTLLPKVLHELYELTASLGGRISGEHGIGHKRKQYMPIFVSVEYLDMLRSIKKALDPNNILNPGKIFDVA
ncbi:MAG: FAD-binding protein [Planctomycetaceae bacterium]|nr:FAD-binding protein [Planctomycetaceae bacterium]